LFQFSGLVTDLKDVHVTQVSLGKAHAVALTNKGHIYTFGINNKGQCGRDFAAQVKEGVVHLNLVYFDTNKNRNAEENRLMIMYIVYVLPITNMVIVRNFEVISNNFNIVGLCTGEYYVHKWITVLCNC
jgi:alpha-tubulin suppressor-like RCC1 family protein